MTIYRVIDNGICALITADELTALRKLRSILEKYDVTFGWVDEEAI